MPLAAGVGSERVLRVEAGVAIEVVERGEAAFEGVGGVELAELGFGGWRHRHSVGVLVAGSSWAAG